MQRTPVVVILGAFLGAALLAMVAVGLARALVDDPAGKAAKTKLDERIETARQIRRALATPIPPPEPLQPITAKPLRVQNIEPADESKAPALSRRARDSMARELRRSPSSLRGTGTGGW
ncbi:MAG: hypothetical protein K2Y27_01650 [Xanthobacteraceae bacterium]|nr:hypothetical protein [Xanthobacteraceae bacterium]